MTTTFTNAGGPITTIASELYISPAGVNSIVYTTVVSNTDLVHQHWVTIDVVFASGPTVNNLGTEMVIPINQTLDYHEAINLNPGDALRFTGDADGVLVAFMSIVQLS